MNKFIGPMGPLKLKTNRVRRPFLGGRLLDEWQGAEHPADGFQAEAWVASIVEARNPEPIKNEGLSEVDLGNGGTAVLKDLIQSFLEGMLEKNYIKIWD